MKHTHYQVPITCHHQCLPIISLTHPQLLMRRLPRLLFLLMLGGAVLLFSPPPALEAQSRDWRFGVVEAYESSAEANNLGAAWTRVKIHWAVTQAGGPGSWTPPVSDGQINGEIGNGRLVVGLLIGIPDWARDSNRLPRGLYLAHDDPGNTWANFVREAVSRYNGRINHWIIWNEPDVWDTAAPGHTWDGSVEDFFQLHRTAYIVAKETNPNARIHLSAMTYHWDSRYGREQYLNRLMRIIAADPNAAGNDYYFDYLTAHFYFQPDQIFHQIQEFHGIRAAHGIPWKPLWLVETNAPPLDDPGWLVPNWTLSVTQNEQAAFMPQMLAVSLAAGAERIAVYKLKDTEGDRAANPEPFGLLRRDGSRRPAFTTYRIATQYLAGMQGARRERWNEVGQIRINQGSVATTVLFARLPAPQTAQVEATAATAVLVDMWGSRQTITASGGFFTVELPGALCTQSIGDYCMIGGTTYYLVQAAGDGPLPTTPPGPGAPPANTPAPVASPASAMATATVTATATAMATNTPRPTLPPTYTPQPTATAQPLPSATATPPPTPPITPTGEPVALLAPTEMVSTPERAGSDSVQAGGENSGGWLLAGLALLLLATAVAGWMIFRQRFTPTS
jgi:hypothetical protein